MPSEPWWEIGNDDYAYPDTGYPGTGSGGNGGGRKGGGRKGGRGGRHPPRGPGRDPGRQPARPPPESSYSSYGSSGVVTEPLLQEDSVAEVEAELIDETLEAEEGEGEEEGGGGGRKRKKKGADCLSCQYGIPVGAGVVGGAVVAQFMGYELARGALWGAGAGVLYGMFVNGEAGSGGGKRKRGK